MAFFAYPNTVEMQYREVQLLGVLPVVLAMITLVLCLRFNRSRMFFVTLSLLLSYSIVHWYVPSASPVMADIMWAASSLLLPVNIAVFSLMKERGMFTWWGLSRFTIIILPILVIAAIAGLNESGLQQLLASRPFEQNLINGVNIYQLPLLIMLLALLVLYGLLFVRAQSQNATLLTVLIAAAVMIHFWDDAGTNAIFASSAMLMIIINVVQQSWSMAYIDQLTGLPGRRALDETMLKLGGRYTIAMIDIDHFKNFNDKHGHDAGDQVLSMVGGFIRRVGSGGKAFRYGGEEFTVVFPGKNIDDAYAALDSLREAIGCSKFRLRSIDRRMPNRKAENSGKTVNVTISIGVANRDERLLKPQDVIKQADKALYRAKKQGRNRVCK